MWSFLFISTDGIDLSQFCVTSYLGHCFLQVPVPLVTPLTSIFSLPYQQRGWPKMHTWWGPSLNLPVPPDNPLDKVQRGNLSSSSCAVALSPATCSRLTMPHTRAVSQPHLGVSEVAVLSHVSLLFTDGPLCLECPSHPLFLASCYVSFSNHFSLTSLLLSVTQTWVALVFLFLHPQYHSLWELFPTVSSRCTILQDQCPSFHFPTTRNGVELMLLHGWTEGWYVGSCGWWNGMVIWESSQILATISHILREVKRI